MRTTVNIPEELAQRAKAVASKRRQPLNKLIIDGLQNIVSTNSAKPALRKKQTAQTGRASAASSWLAEWQSLSRKASARIQSSLSAAEVVSKMRR